MTVARQGRRGLSVGGGVISNGSSTNFECDSFTGWTNFDTINGITSLDTFESRSVFKSNGGDIYNASNTAGVVKELTAPASGRCVVSYVMYL